MSQQQQHPSPSATLPKIYYINLDHRADRRQEFEHEMDILRDQAGNAMPEVVRVPAIKHSVGSIGCGQSHCLALQKFLDSGDTTAIIMEDDFTFSPRMIPMLVEYLRSGIPSGADVFLLAANLRQHQPWSNEFIRVYRSFTTSGYWITRQAAEALLRLWECCTTLHTICITQPNPKYCIDVAWFELMHPDSPYVFLALTPLIGQIGYQRPGYSDIELRHVHYGV
jgi:GR25 family glycosyltransferase involved in LPS biosynthesis